MARNEQSGRPYLMLEGTDAKVHFIQYIAEIEKARSNGELRVNSFVRLQKKFIGGRPTVDVQDLGNAERILNNRKLLRETARALLKRGVLPTEDGWDGWLGRYQEALARMVGEILRNRGLATLRSPERKRDLVAWTVIGACRTAKPIQFPSCGRALISMVQAAKFRFPDNDAMVHHFALNRTLFAGPQMCT